MPAIVQGKLTMLWLYIHFVSLPVAMYQRATPQTSPFAVVSPPSSRCTQVLWTNTTANAQGIEQGMTLDTALCLEPALICITYNEHSVHEQLLSLAEWAYHYSASITPYPPDGLLLEIGSMRQLFGGLNALWETLSADLSNQGFQHQLATGFTPLAARILACSNQGIPNENPDDLTRALLATPLHSCFLPEGCADKLNGIGVNQLQQVLKIPRHELGKRFGQTLCLHLSRLLGEISDPQRLFRPPEYFRRKLVFCHEITEKTALLFPLKRLLAELEIFLQKRQLATDLIELILTHRQTSSDQTPPTTSISIRSATAQSQQDEFLQLTLLRFDTINLPSPIIQMTLYVDRLVEANHHQKDFFLSGRLTKTKCN